MALQENLSTYSYEAAGAIDQYLLVAHDAAPRTVKRAAAADLVVGVTLNRSTAAGQALTVACGGILKVKAGAAIAAGAPVASDATGRAVTAGAAARAFGTAITAATAAGEVIEVHAFGSFTV